MNTFAKFAPIFALTAMVAVASAQSPAGSWNGKLNVSVPDLPKDLPQSQRDMVEKQLDQVRAMKFDLKVLANKKFTLTITGGMFPKPEKAEGTWTQTGKTIKMVTTTKNGKPTNEQEKKPLEAVISANGKSMEAKLPGQAAGKVMLVFTKA